MDFRNSQKRDLFWEAYRGCAEENRVRPDRSPFYVRWVTINKKVSCHIFRHSLSSQKLFSISVISKAFSYLNPLSRPFEHLTKKG